MTILPPKQGCDGNHELGCTHERGHFGRFFAFAKFAFSQPLLFEDLGYLLGFRERLQAPVYRRVAINSDYRQFLGHANTEFPCSGNDSNRNLV